MNKKFLTSFILNFLFVFILIIFNTLIIKKVSLISVENLIILCIGIVLSIIISKIILTPSITPSSKEKTSKGLRAMLLSFIDEIERMKIDTDTLESTYINSIKLFQSIITDKDTNVIIEKHFRSIVDSEIKRAARYNLKFGILLLKIYSPDTVKKTISIKSVIRELSALSRKILRVVDIIGRYKDGLIYLLPQTDFKGTITAGERILKEIKRQKFIGKDGNPVEIKVNIGVSAFPQQGKSYESLIKSAEKNIQQAELLGGNRVIFGSL